MNHIGCFFQKQSVKLEQLNRDELIEAIQQKKGTNPTSVSKASSSNNLYDDNKESHTDDESSEDDAPLEFSQIMKNMFWCNCDKGEVHCIREHPDTIEIPKEQPSQHCVLSSAQRALSNSPFVSDISFLSANNNSQSLQVGQSLADSTTNRCVNGDPSSATSLGTSA